ncbi:hypothetical protein PMIN06_011513 [Paraphaeosphaeria minitans]
MTSNVDSNSRWVTALRTQPKTVDALPQDALSCPYCENNGRIFQTLDQLYSHAKVEHASLLDTMDPETARTQVQDASLRMKGLRDQSSDAPAGGRSTPDITGLSLEARGRLSQFGKKEPADSDLHVRRSKASVHQKIYDEEECAKELRRPVTERTRPKPSDPRLYDLKQHFKGAESPYRTPEVASEWSVETNRSQTQSRTPQSTTYSPSAQQHPPRPAISPTRPHSQLGLIENQRYDARYPGLLLQPDSRPISQEQLASEVKSIYAGLTMVETKCIHVDRAQAAALQDGSDPTSRLASDHWQALIALHRTLLHEHHDFFLASQHPSASPALRRLAAKYSMPARMWKHGIHSFLELLRRRLPESIDYMLAFIYLAYQMMALLYETVPAFEDTWIECLGDLGRYRMAIEDENPRDRETWAGVARSWYSKAADKNPSVGRLYTT